MVTRRMLVNETESKTKIFSDSSRGVTPPPFKTNKVSKKAAPPNPVTITRAGTLEHKDWLNLVLVL